MWGRRTVRSLQCSHCRQEQLRPNWSCTVRSLRPCACFEEGLCCGLTCVHSHALLDARPSEEPQERCRRGPQCRWQSRTSWWKNREGFRRSNCKIRNRSVGGIPIRGESGIASFYAQGLGPCLPIISKVWRVVGRCGRLASLTTCDAGIWALRTDSEFTLQRSLKKLGPT